MANCKSQKYVGRDVVLEYQIGCGDTLPNPASWLRVGSMRTKELGIEWETADATADDSISSLRENLATFLAMTISGDGTAKASGRGAAEVIALTKHVINPIGTAGQPSAWIRMTFPDLTFTAFMLVTNMSRSAPYDDVVTFSFEASSTSSDFGLLVEDTPDPDAPEPTGVTTSPATASVAVGATQQLAATVAPAGASQSVTWATGNAAVATVSATGLVTATGAGTTTITATSNAAPGLSATTNVTVTAVPASVTVTPATLSLEPSDTEQLTVSVLPAGAPQGVTWTSSDPAVATVTAGGLVTAVADGTATITATSTTASVSGNCAVTVTA